MVNTLSANPTKWSNTLNQFVFDPFVGLVLKGLSHGDISKRVSKKSLAKEQTNNYLRRSYVIKKQ